MTEQGGTVADGTSPRSYRSPHSLRPGDADLRAMGTFCRDQHARLVGLLALYVGDRAVAEELAQETLVRVCQQWPKVRDMSAPSAWTTRVAMNLASSWWRRRSAERRAHARHGGEPTTAPEHDPSGGAEVETVRRAVAALPERQRRAIVLRFYGDLSVAEVADAMRCPPGTVTSLTHRGLTALRTHEGLHDLREPGDGPDPPGAGRSRPSGSGRRAAPEAEREVDRHEP